MIGNFKLPFLLVTALALVVSCSKDSNEPAGSTNPERQIYYDTVSVKGEFVKKSDAVEYDSERDSDSFNNLMVEYPSYYSVKELLKALQAGKKMTRRTVEETLNSRRSGLEEFAVSERSENMVKFSISDRTSQNIQSIGSFGVQSKSTPFCELSEEDRYQCQWTDMVTELLPDIESFERVYNAAKGVPMLSSCSFSGEQQSTTTAIEGSYKVNSGALVVPAVQRIEKVAGRVSCVFYKYGANNGELEMRDMGDGTRTHTKVITKAVIPQHIQGQSALVLNHEAYKLDDGTVLYTKIIEVVDFN